MPPWVCDTLRHASLGMWHSPACLSGLVYRPACLSGLVYRPACLPGCVYCTGMLPWVCVLYRHASLPTGCTRPASLPTGCTRPASHLRERAMRRREASILPKKRGFLLRREASFLHKSVKDVERAAQDPGAGLFSSPRLFPFHCWSYGILLFMPDLMPDYEPFLHSLHILDYSRFTVGQESPTTFMSGNPGMSKPGKRH